MKMRKKAALLLTGIVLIVLAGCGNEEPRKESTAAEGLSELGKVTVVSREDGSGTRSTFAQLLDFQENDKGKTDLTTEDAVITVCQSDSTDGLTGAMNGTYDFGMASRELKDYEKELLNYEMIAKDGIAVIVNKENPLTNISLEQIKKIYTGDEKEWGNLNE
ncbi:MAG: substrate-binding domain-containing protein [Bacillota bacterium]|nr:substrate-binding domain-containing protein [Bacillota bacterium]